MSTVDHQSVSFGNATAPSPSREQCSCHPFSVHPATHQSPRQADTNASQFPTHLTSVAVRSLVRTLTNPEHAVQLRIMRALAPVLRRIFQQERSSIGSHLHHQPRYNCNPHLDYHNLARARAFTFSPPRRPRSPSFSSLSGRKGGEEDEVLDMEAGTVRCAANYAPLTPISFIERAAAVYGGRAAVVYGERRRTWAEARDRCVRAAAALATRFGVERGDVVSANRGIALSSHLLAASLSCLLFWLISCRIRLSLRGR
jgi:hypothetical protein